MELRAYLNLEFILIMVNLKITSDNICIFLVWELDATADKFEGTTETSVIAIYVIEVIIIN